MNFAKDIFLPKVNIEIKHINESLFYDAKGFIEECEQRYENDVKNTVERILLRKADIVMISGPSGSGKTTSSNKIAKCLNDMGAGGVVVSLDDFFRNYEDYPELENGQKDFESVYALDLDEVHRCLNELATDGYSMLPKFDFKKQCRSEERREVDIRGGKVVVIEGIHALNPLLSESVKEGKIVNIYAGLRNEYTVGGKLMLNTRDLRIVRRIIRDYKFRNYTPEQTLSVWDNIMAGENKWIKKFKDNADLLINTSFIYEPCLYTSYITSYARSDVGGVYDDIVDRLAAELGHFCELEENLIPESSMLHEFIG